MKKATLKKKYPSIQKNKTFRTLWSYYRQTQKDYQHAVEQHLESKKTHQKLKATASTPKSLLLAWGYERKRARNAKKLYRLLLNDAYKQVKKWLRLYAAQQQFADNRPQLKKMEKLGDQVKLAVDQTTRPPSEVKKTPTAKNKKSPKKKNVVKKLVKRAKATTSQKPKSSTKSKTKQKDNLKRLSGIGVKIEQVLQAAGIATFAKLSNTSLATLRDILEKAGPRYRIANPITWPQQAGLAAAEQWEALKALQDKLREER